MVKQLQSNSCSFLAVLLVAVCLCGLGESSNWQASGNMSDYMVKVRELIDFQIGRVDSGQIRAVDISKQLTAAFTKAWEKSWNVLVSYTNQTSDSIVYGYAFRNHWAWLNNYGTKHWSIVLWKEYNCNDNWVSLTSSSYVNNFDDQHYGVVDIFSSEQTPENFADPWALGFRLVNRMNENFNNEAYSVLVSQGEPSFYSANICCLTDSDKELYIAVLMSTTVDT